MTDIVMIDAISTGYSRPVSGENPNQFHGVRGDLQWFGEFIRRYLTRFNRSPSPKFLLGERYGTFRSAGLVGELQQRHGIELNGIVLVSTVLDFASIRNAENNDRPYITFLPTYTATAWYHKKLAADLQGDLKKALDEARNFAVGEYASALVKGNRMTEAERKGMAVRKKTILSIASVACLSFLGFFKYYNFGIDNVNTLLAFLQIDSGFSAIAMVLPIGVSFYTFSGLSYIFDIYLGKLKPEQYFYKYALFISYFPHLLAGPIVRAGQFLPQLNNPFRFT